MRHTADAREEGRHPEGQPAEGEGVGAITENREDVRAVTKEIEVCGDRAAVRRVHRSIVVLTARHVLHQQHQRGQGQARKSRDPECPAPSQPCADEPSQDVTDGRADGNRGKEDCEDPAPAMQREVIGEQGRRNRAVSGLSHADQRAGEKQRREPARESAEGRGDAPDGNPERDERRTLPAVAEKAEEGRRQQVDDDEAHGHESQLRIRDVQRHFDGIEHRRHDEAVEVVEEIDEGEDT